MILGASGLRFSRGDQLHSAMWSVQVTAWQRAGQVTGDLRMGVGVVYTESNGSHYENAKTRGRAAARGNA